MSEHSPSSGYDIYERLGRGGFGAVHRAKSRKDNSEVAIKLIEKKKITNARLWDRVHQEVAVHYRLKHPSIIEFYDCYKDDNYVYIVMELCHMGNLQRYLDSRADKVLTEDEARTFMQQIVRGVHYLQIYDILHRDLSLANLLLTKDMNVKIADFGLVILLQNSEEKHFTMCGTPNYISPEMAWGHGHGPKTDIWSLGCILYTFLVGKCPFSNDTVEGTIDRVKQCEYELPTTLSHDARHLIQALLQDDPSKRPSPAEILKYPFMTVKSRSHKIIEMSMDSGHGTISSSRHNSSVSSSSSTRAHPLPAFPLLNVHIQEDGKSCHSLASASNGRALTSFRQGISLTDRHPQSPPVRERESHSQEEYKKSRAAMNDNCRNKPTLQVGTLGGEGKPGVCGGHCHCQQHCGADLGGRHAPASSNFVGNKELGDAATSNLQGRERGCQAFDPCKCEDPHSSNNSQSVKSVHAFQHGAAGHYSECGPLHKQQSGGPTPSDWSHQNCKSISPGQNDEVFNVNSAKTPNQQPSKFESLPVSLLAQNSLSNGHQYMVSNGIKNKPKNLQPANFACVGLPVQFSSSEKASKVQLTEREVQHCLVESKETRPRSAERQEPCSLRGPLNTQRLRPIRQRTMNVVAHVTDTGSVCLEFIKRKNEVDRVREVLIISSDGKQICVYQPEGRGVPLTDQPPPVPERCQTFEYSCIPSKYIKKYQYAARFVCLIQSKTPKVTMYTDRAKCMLMENTPKPDFIAEFYDGAKVSSSVKDVRIIEPDGKSLTLESLEIHPRLSGETQDILKYIQQCHDQCVKLEQAISSVQSSSPSQLFPVIVGRRPDASNNRRYGSSPAVDETTQPVQPYISAVKPQGQTSLEGTILNSTASLTLNATSPASSTTGSYNSTTHTQQTTAYVIVQIVVQNSDSEKAKEKVLWAIFDDGTQLGLSATSVKFVSKTRTTNKYTLTDDMPGEVKHKLSMMQSELESRYQHATPSPSR